MNSSRRLSIATLVSTICASSMGFLAPSMVNVASPAIQSNLGADGPQLLWIANSETLMLACLILVGGALGDRFGRKRVFALGTITYATAALLCAFTNSVQLLIGLRVLQGIGGSLMVPGSLALIAANFEEKRRGGAIGIWSAATSAAILVAPIIGGSLVNAGLWRGVFLIHIPLALASLISLLWVPESRNPHRQKLDWIGVAFITLSLFLISYGAIEAGRTALNSRTLLSILIGLAFFIFFILLEAKIAHPILPLRLFRSRQFFGANLFTIFLYGALQSVLFLFILNLIQIQNYNPVFVGIAVLPSTLLLVLLSPWMGRMADRIGTRPLLFLGALLVGSGMIGLGLVGVTQGSEDYLRSYFVPMILIGLGLSMVVSPLSTAVMNSSDQQLVGTASGINNAISRAAGVLAIAVIGSLMLSLYGGAIRNQVAALSLEPNLKAEIIAQATELGNAQVPESIPIQLQNSVQDLFQQSFVQGFRWVALIGGGLCWLSAIAALLFISKRRLRAS